MEKRDAEMMADELRRNGNEREAMLVGNYQAGNDAATIRAIRSIGGTIAMVFCVGDRTQEIGIPEQIRLEHAIRVGDLVRI